MDLKKFPMKLKMTFPFSVKTWASWGDSRRKSLLRPQNVTVMELPDFICGCEEPKSKGIITRTLHGNPSPKSSVGLHLSTLS